MSLARLALRLAAVESLAAAANAENGPWATAAGARVYDSRVDPIAAAMTEDEYSAALAALDNKPIVTIYTEDDHSLPYGSEKLWPNEQTVTLIAEIMIAEVGPVVYEMPDGTEKTLNGLAPGASDRERAALLDLIDSQIRRAFQLDATPPAIVAPLFRKVAMECASIHDDPQRDVHRTARLALRTVKFHVKIKKEVWPALGATPLEGIAALPSPLAEVAQGLPESSSAYAVCIFVASALAAPVPMPPALEGVRIFTTLDRPNSGATAAPSPAALAAASFATPGTVPFDINADIGSVD